MPFIPIDKMKQLREAAKNGDARAQKILQAHLAGKDYNADFEAYFAPAPAQAPVQEPKQAVGTGNERLDEFLRGNGVKEGDPDYEDAVNDYYNEFPNERPVEEGKTRPVQNNLEPEFAVDVEEEVDLTKDMAQGIIELIAKCDQTLLIIMQNESIDDTTRKGAMTTLQEIKQSLFDNADKVKKIKQSLCKKEEANEGGL